MIKWKYMWMTRLWTKYVIIGKENGMNKKRSVVAFFSFFVALLIVHVAHVTHVIWEKTRDLRIYRYWKRSGFLLIWEWRGAFMRKADITSIIQLFRISIATLYISVEINQILVWTSTFLISHVIFKRSSFNPF